MKIQNELALAKPFIRPRIVLDKASEVDIIISPP
jgi:hypothetical protein